MPIIHLCCRPERRTARSRARQRRWPTSSRPAGSWSQWPSQPGAPVALLDERSGRLSPVAEAGGGFPPAGTSRPPLARGIGASIPERVTEVAIGEEGGPRCRSGNRATKPTPHGGGRLDAVPVSSSRSATVGRRVEATREIAHHSRTRNGDRVHVARRLARPGTSRTRIKSSSTPAPRRSAPRRACNRCFTTASDRHSPSPPPTATRRFSVKHLRFRPGEGSSGQLPHAPAAVRRRHGRVNGARCRSFGYRSGIRAMPLPRWQRDPGCHQRHRSPSGQVQPPRLALRSPLAAIASLARSLQGSGEATAAHASPRSIRSPCRSIATSCRDSMRRAERARRQSSPLSVLMLDVDNFKQLNDRLAPEATRSCAWLAMCCTDRCDCSTSAPAMAVTSSRS